MISIIFLYEAYDSIYYFNMTKDTMQLYGLTWRQRFVVIGAIILLLLGGLMVLIGYRSSFGSIFFIIVLYTGNLRQFILLEWSGQGSAYSEYHVYENLAIIGGLLMIIANGSGRYSIKRLLATLHCLIFNSDIMHKNFIKYSFFFCRNGCYISGIYQSVWGISARASTTRDWISVDIVHFDFAGEELPREIRMSASSWPGAYKNTYLHSSTILNLKLAARRFPLIESILKESGIPEDFKFSFR